MTHKIYTYKDNYYVLSDEVDMKCVQTGAWYAAMQYDRILKDFYENNKCVSFDMKLPTFVREKEDFYKKFTIVQ